MSDFTPYAVSVEDMMLARDERVHAQNEFLAKAASYSAPLTLLSFGMNIPGAVKQTPLIRNGFLFGKARITELLKREGFSCLLTRELRRVSGDTWLCLVGAPPAAMKRLAVSLEDSEPLARLFDIDVLDSKGRKLSREDFALPPRRCLLCEEAAVVCARSRAHSVEALFSRCETLLREAFPRSASFFSALENQAALALLDEVYAAPKPGLVDRIDAGAHADMKFEDFILSTAAISPFLREMAVTAYQNCFPLPASPGAARETEAALFPRLREIGKRAEREMYAATGGVNTHKGAIFSMGILCAAAASLPADRWDESETILSICARMTKGIVAEDYRNLTVDTAKTAGQRLYLEYGITGVRGQMEEGLPAVSAYGLPLLEKLISEGRSTDEAGAAVLLAILSHTTDTNLIARSDLPTQKEASRRAGELLEHSPCPPREQIEELDREFIQKNLSPGGSADLLALCWMLHFLKTDRSP
mgnify:CR=1 FL=1